MVKNMATITENQGDASADTGTRYALSVGDTFQGRLDSIDDVDWIRVELSAGTNYDFNLNGEISLGFDIYDSAGNYLASGNQSNFGPKLTGSPDVSDTYYIAVKGRDNDSAGDYELSLDVHLITTGSYDEIADYLTDGSFEWAGAPSFAFDIEPGGAITVGITALPRVGQQLARLALEAWTSVTGIGFEFVDGDSAQITFVDDEEGAFSEGVIGDDGVISSYVNISPDFVSEAGIGSYSVYVYMHEIGHALGLGHPGPYNAVTVSFGVHNIFLIDSWQATILSGISQTQNTYINASDALPVTPMIADIIAIQNLYGVPTDIRTGDTVYGYQSNVDGYLGRFFELWTEKETPVNGYQSNVDGYLGWLFELWTEKENPFSSDVNVGPHSAPALADLDGDSDFDLVIVAESGNIIYYLENTGTATSPSFTQRTGAANPLDGFSGGYNGTPALADLDGDADPDLVVVAEDGAIYYFENTGTATSPGFTQRTGAANPLNGVAVDSYSTATFVDLDGDSDPDIIVGKGDGAIDYYENTGTATSPGFTQRTGAANPLDGVAVGTVIAPVVIDLDVDGDPDLVVVVENGAILYYENTGTATSPNFTERAGATNTLEGVYLGYYGALTFADLDGDGDHDLIATTQSSTVDYYENTGTLTQPEVVNQNLVPAALTLIDNGGNDTLDLRTDTADQRVDLHPEGISDVYGLVGNLVIARDTVIENYIAGAGDDVVTGNSAANSLEGRNGNDVLHGLEGDDKLYGGAGADMLNGGPGEDYAYYLDSAVGVLVRLHNAQAVKYGDAEGDTLIDIEHLVGSEHNDILAGDGEDNILEGRNGDDVLYGGPAGGDDRMYGGSGDDRIFGGKGNDILTGGEGNDYLKGGPGEDTFIVDGDDMDVLYGGPEQDTFQFFPSNLGGGSIRDFNDGEDVIDLTEFTGINSMDDLDIVSHGDNVLIELSGSDYLTTIILSDFDVNNLDATDFLF